MFEDKSTSVVSRCYGADAYKPVKASNPKEVIEISPDIEPAKAIVLILGKYKEAKKNVTNFRKIIEISPDLREIIEISPDLKEGVNCDTLTSFIKYTEAVNEFLSEHKYPIPKTCISDIDNQLPDSGFDDDTYNVYKLCETENMVFFFAELGLMQYSMIEICPSMSAASAIYAARLTLKKIPAWPETLKCYTKFSESQLMHCAKILIKCHLDAPKSELKTVYEKYSAMDYGVVVLHQPASRYYCTR